MSCSPKCKSVASLAEGPRLKMSMSDKGKFPYGTIHPWCLSCIQEQIAEAFPNSEESLLLRFEKLKAKL